ncbi:hypothetical protein ABZ897_49640 [Nonomuraea sp. NPDC046802]|uniref:hypothetical protein n=1 Tax=Nonomuraea sp. NPDC046802 TaxID=3154919 RepID=UPI0033EDEE70
MRFSFSTKCAGDKAVAAPMRWSQRRTVCPVGLMGKLTVAWSPRRKTCGPQYCNAKDVRVPKLRVYNSSDTHAPR